VARALTRHRDLNGTTVGDLLHQPQQVDLVVSEADLHIVRTDGINADGLAREDGQEDALSQMAMGREAEDVGSGSCRLRGSHVGVCQMRWDGRAR
jgi:hypothetical protein